MLLFLLEMNRCEDIALEPFFGNQLLNYRGTFSHNSLPSWYLQPFQREDEKVISLLRHSVNTTGNVSTVYEHALSSKTCTHGPLCVLQREFMRMKLYLLPNVVLSSSFTHIQIALCTVSTVMCNKPITYEEDR